MADLDEQLRVVSSDIDRAEASSLTARNDKERTYYRKKEEQLRKEKEQLREEKIILMRRQDATGK
jgi:hypothetical protein